MTAQRLPRRRPRGRRRLRATRSQWTLTRCCWCRGRTTRFTDGTWI
nr:MAG TPA: hypothetical protein [Caudoviricetes sp.]